jgi:Ca2+-binding EF-hand superfamily protein
MRQTPSAQSGAQGRPASSMFNSLDNNRDGYLDSNEGSTSTSLRNNRQVMDLDRDGRISQTEWETFTREGIEHRSLSRPARPWRRAVPMP